MHSVASLRDDISVCSGRSSVSGVAFRRTWSISRRDSPIHYRDDLSEYSNASSSETGPGPLNVCDYRVVAEGLQERRTVAMAVVRAEWERQLHQQIHQEAKFCNVKYARVGPRATRRCFQVWRRTRAPPSQPAVKFTWSEVQSLVLLPAGESPPYLMVITTCRLPEEKEWLLQAGSLRGRARFAVEVVAAVLRARRAVKQREGTSCSRCCASGNVSSALEAFHMDAARAACETARLQPSPEGMERLEEVLNLLAKSQLQQPLIPNTAFQRFGDVVRRCRTDFSEWQQWQVLSHLILPPPGWDAVIWNEHILPFLLPRDPTLRNADFRTYPATVDHHLAIAVERCQRTLS